MLPSFVVRAQFSTGDSSLPRIKVNAWRALGQIQPNTLNAFLVTRAGSYHLQWKMYVPGHAGRWPVSNAGRWLQDTPYQGMLSLLEGTVDKASTQHRASHTPHRSRVSKGHTNMPDLIRSLCPCTTKVMRAVLFLGPGRCWTEGTGLHLLTLTDMAFRELIWACTFKVECAIASPI